MKMDRIRLMAVVVGIVGLMMLGGCGEVQGKLSYIGVESAKSVAMEAAGIDGALVENVVCDLKERDGRDYYQIDINHESGTFSYDIDALSGAVIKGSEILNRQNTDEMTEGDNAGEMAGSDNADELTDSINTEEVIYSNNAVEVKNGNNAVEVKNGNNAVEVKNGNNAGEITNSHPGAAQGAIGENDAKMLALSRVPGAGMEHLLEFKTDNDDGILEYEGTIIFEGTEYEFEIDAYSGAFREWDSEPVDWD